MQAVLKHLSRLKLVVERQGKYDTKKRVTTISWIPFAKLPQMYKVIENQLSIVNLNHFMFDGVTLN
jgi:hypothetical protein